MTDSGNKKKRRNVLTMMLIAVMTVGYAVFGLSLGEVKAFSNVTVPLKLFGTDGANSIDKLSTEGWKWDAGNKELILENNFTLNYTADLEPALKIAADSTIVLKGNATINTNNKAIVAMGNLTIKSYEGCNGHLKIVTNQAATEASGDKYCGIEFSNHANIENLSLTVTDRAIVEFDSHSNGDGCLWCWTLDHEGKVIDCDSKPATVKITDQGAVQLKCKDSGFVAKGFRLNSSQQILYINNTTSVLYKKNDIKSLSSETNKTITMMACEFPGISNGDQKNYSLVYDGEDHPIVLNQDESTLEGLGIQPVMIIPQKIYYYDSIHSEYLKEEDADYREKDVAKKEIQYAEFHSKDRGRLVNASKYLVKYNGNEIASLEIQKRPVTISNLKAENKTYDGWEDAKINYDDIRYHIMVILRMESFRQTRKRTEHSKIILFHLQRHIL